MLNKLLATSAITALTIGVAAAQAIPPGPDNAPPAAAPAPTGKATEMSMPANASTAKFINSQRSDQYLASKFKGTDVLGTDSQKIGDVSDILFDKNGKILAYVVSVGGFLGIGSKYVALEPAAFQVVAGDPSKHESDKLKIAMNKDQLTQAAAFESYKAPATTTGMGSGGPMRAPGGAAGVPR